MLEPRPDWYKDAIIYEVHVRAFHDSVGDGHGDFRGLTRKLDYLEDLGVNTLWVLPFYPSPQRDDGYDIADYTNIHPQFGTLQDFQEFLTEAHRRGLRVITELVINHTSDQHPWFQRARRAPRDSPERNFYVWSDTPDKYRNVRVIFQDFEPSNWSWDPVAEQYFWHRFYRHQPDLNYDNPAVCDAILPIVDFWFNLGVDGMRLDAIPYLFVREGTLCENLPETHAFLKRLRQHIDSRFPGRMLLAEANQWPEDAVEFFGDDDECHMAFHFPLMPRLFMAVHEENSFPIVDILAQTPAIPANCQWCLFLRNHDELTLEMVTEEERDYMYRAYTRERQARINMGIRHRLAPLLRNDRRRIELLNALLFSLPGTPVVYYGDEIGMGDNIYLGDRNGVRTPMQWSPDRNAGFSRANPQKLYLPIIIDPEYHYEAVNVESQQNNPSSLLWWMKRLIALRKKHPAFSRGSMDILPTNNPRILAFLRRQGDDRILVVANLSRFVQPVQFNLHHFVDAGCIPEELFGRAAFPTVSDRPYFLTLAPHGFYWFSLTESRSGPVSVAALDSSAMPALPVLDASLPVAQRFAPGAWDELEPILPGYLARRGLCPSTEVVLSARILDVGHIVTTGGEIWFVLARFDYRSGHYETLALPLTFVPDGAETQTLRPIDRVGFARIEGPVAGYLCHAMSVRDCSQAILASILNGQVLPLGEAEIAARPLGSASVAVEDLATLAVTMETSERNNLSIVYGEAYFLKTFRRLEEGINPDLEVGRFLTQQVGYTGTAPVVGWLEYRRRHSEPATLGVLHRYVPHQSSAWQAVLDQLSRYFEHVAAFARQHPPSPQEWGDTEHAVAQFAGDWEELLDACPEMARKLAQRTAEMHLALASEKVDPAFAPEPFDKRYQRGLYQSLRNLTARVCQHLRQEQSRLPAGVLPQVRQLLSSQDRLLQRFAALLDGEFDGLRIRCHGDYHLGHLLFTGGDFVVIDFEGDSTRTVGERRTKRSPLSDVAGMIRSFHYAAYSVLLGLASSRGRSYGMIREEDRAGLKPWAQAWCARMKQEFLGTYLRAITGAGLVPQTTGARERLLHVLLLEKALREIDAELATRPDWVILPLKGALRLLDSTL